MLFRSWYAQGLDFADALHLALSGEVKQLFTFDRGFAKLAKKNASTTAVVEARD